MEWWILFSDRIILTLETAQHGFRAMFGPYETREAAEADFDRQDQELRKKIRAQKRFDLFPLSCAIIGIPKEELHDEH